MTLQNALRPLPDTQRDSPGHDLSSPAEQDGGVQLLSRPQDLDIDPGESFFWGKPVKIIPGQFSRPVPKKSMVDVIKEKDPATSPKVIGRPSSKAPDAIASGSVQAPPLDSRQFGSVVSPNSRRLLVEQSSHTVLSSNEGRLKSEENTQPVGNDTAHSTPAQSSARRPPFEDYQPQYQRPNCATVAQPSPAHRPTRPEALGMIETQHLGANQVKSQIHRRGKPFSEQGRGSHHSVTQHQQEDQPTRSAQVKGPSHRISLPNDTSVSPGQAPRYLPKETSQHQAMRESLVPQNSLAKSPSLNLNRPMKDVRRVSEIKTPTNPPSSRSSMQGSNIRKKRSRPRPSASGTACTRQQDSNYRDETPSVRIRDPQIPESYRSSPLEDSQQPFGAPEIDEVAEKVAQALNSNFGDMRDRWMQKDQEISYLKHKSRKQEQRLSNFERQSEGKSGRIQELEEEGIRLQERLESANQQLEDRCTKLSELQKKCRTYKEHLNSATEEQQDLYKAAKAKCESAIKQMREEERKRKVMDEQQRRDLQATRERLTQVVKSTVAEYSSKERECKWRSCRRNFCHKLMNSSQQQTRGVEPKSPGARS